MWDTFTLQTVRTENLAKRGKPCVREGLRLAFSAPNAVRSQAWRSERPHRTTLAKAPTRSIALYRKTDRYVAKGPYFPSGLLDLPPFQLSFYCVTIVTIETVPECAQPAERGR